MKAELLQKNGLRDWPHQVDGGGSICREFSHMDVLSEPVPKLNREVTREECLTEKKAPDATHVFWSGMTNSLPWVFLWTLTAFVWQKIFARSADGASVGYYESLALIIAAMAFGLIRFGLVSSGIPRLEFRDRKAGEETFVDARGWRKWKGWNHVLSRAGCFLFGLLGLVYLGRLGFWVLPMGMIIGAIMTATLCWAWIGLSFRSRWARLSLIIPAGFLISFVLFQSAMPQDTITGFVVGICLWWTWLAFWDGRGSGRSSLGALAFAAGVTIAPAHWSGTGMAITLTNGILFGMWLMIHRWWCKSGVPGHESLSHLVIWASFFLFGFFALGYAQLGAPSDRLVATVCFGGTILWLIRRVPSPPTWRRLGAIWPLLIGVIGLWAA